MTTQTDQFNFSFIKSVFRKILPNSQAFALAIILLIGFLLVFLLSDLLMPVFASIVLAYLLEGLICKLENLKVPRLIAVHMVFTMFITGLGFILFFLMPVVTEQAVELIQHLPEIIRRLQSEIMLLPKMYPQFISETRIKELMFAVQHELLQYGQSLLSLSAASVVGLVTAVVYMFLVPLMIFFFLKDKVLIIDWFLQFLPRERYLTVRVWREVDTQMGNYVRGKFVEVFILWSISFITFSILNLNYAMLLAVLMGLSVIIPYVGATLVTFPVIAVAYFQWGLKTDDFMYVTIAYSIIQAFDGVVLVPLLFSEAVNLHPIAIIVAILLFGGLWGFWGVFFAIPLATVVKAVLTAWPRIGNEHVDIVY